MSFILDALKKSEHERQRQSLPGLVETTIPRARPRLPRWALLMGLLLGINLIALVVLLTRSRMPSTAGPAIAGAPHGVTPIPTAVAERHFSPLDGTAPDASPVYAQEIPVPADAATDRRPARTERPATPSGPAAARTAHRRDAAPLGGSGPSLSATRSNDYKREDQEVLPSISELNLTGAQALPDLHLDVHVFATQPADRFVFINMRKYHEGAVLQEGPTVERIRRDGVVLNYAGLRFLLPRQ